jgi:molecular chaperone DnaJ
MNGKPDYYEILGVDPSASQEEIKRAYRSLARRCHPDVNQNDPEATERFKAATEAYEILSDPQRRSQYDFFGRADGTAPGFGFGGISDIFDAFFGPFEGRRRPSAEDLRGADLRLDIEITLEEAASGAEKTARVNRLVKCGECDGKGGRSGAGPAACPDCRGSGTLRRSSGVFGMQFTAVSTCERCQGTGGVISDPCPSCQGKGRVRKVQKLKVTIPPGVDSGYRVRLRGEGDAGLLGAPHGDLYVHIHLLPHKTFERRGTEVICEFSLPFSIAALGGRIRVPTLYGEEDLHIPAGTQSGAAFRLRGKGLPDPGGRALGDQHVIVKITVPKRLTAEQRQLLRQFAETEGEIVEDDKGLLERVKDVLSGD